MFFLTSAIKFMGSCRGLSSKNNSILKGNAAQDSNDPTIAVRADYSISEFMGVGMAALHGLYANGASTGNIGGVANPAKTMLDSIEIDAWYLKGALSLGGQVSAGQQKQAAFLGGKDASWYGVSGMASYAVATGHDVSLRADYINNKANGGGIMGYPASSPAPIDNGNGASTLVDGRNGFGTRSCNPTTGSCDGANRWALSLGYRYTINPNVAIKTEFRLDGADQDVFMDVGNNTYTNINKLVGMSLVASF